MNFWQKLALPCLATWLGATFLSAQPVLNSQNSFRPQSGTGITNLRVTRQSADGTEVVLTMDYAYDGLAGPNAQAIPLIEKKDQKGVSAWFGADPVAVGIGRGVISLTVKYFNDEPGVPPALTTDRLRILLLNQSGTAILTSIPFLKSIKWGDPKAKQVPLPAPPPTLAQNKREAEAEARRQTEAETARRKEVAQLALTEAVALREADQKQKDEAKALEMARLRAEREAARLAEEKRKRGDELKAREEAARRAEADAQRLAEERRVAQEKAQAEAQARAEARRRADAEAIARRDAEEKAKTEAAAREEARKKAESEAKRLAQEKQEAEAKAKAEAKQKEKAGLLAEAKAREDARLKAEAAAKRLADEKRLADQKAREEANVREQARLQAEVEEKARQRAEEQARTDAATLEAARLKAEAEAKRLAEERAQAEAKAKAEDQARETARLKEEAEAKKLAEAEQLKKQVPPESKSAQLPVSPSRPEAESKVPAPSSSAAPASGAPARPSGQNPAMAALATDLKTKITNVDVVNRSLDRTRMTIGVEYDYKDSLGSKPMLGVDLTKMDEPMASDYFSSQPAEIGKSRRNFVLFPVKFQPPSTLGLQSSFTTDQVLVYLLEATSAKRFNLFPTTMLLLWRPPGATSAATPKTESGNALEVEDFKQTDPQTGYVTVRFNLLAGPGKLRARVFDAANPASTEWISTALKTIQAGRGLQVLDLSVNPEAKSPAKTFKMDRIEVELLDPAGKVVARFAKQVPMIWAKPE